MQYASLKISSEKNKYMTLAAEEIYVLDNIIKRNNYVVSDVTYDVNNPVYKVVFGAIGHGLNQDETKSATNVREYLDKYKNYCLHYNYLDHANETINIHTICYMDYFQLDDAFNSEQHSHFTNVAFVIEANQSFWQIFDSKVTRNHGLPTYLSFSNLNFGENFLNREYIIHLAKIDKNNTKKINKNLESFNLAKLISHDRLLNYMVH